MPKSIYGIMNEEKLRNQGEQDYLPNFDPIGFLQSLGTDNSPRMQQKEVSRRAELSKYGTDPSNLNAILDGSFSTKSAPMASVGNPSKIEMPKPIDPIVKQALMKKMAPTRAPAVEAPMPIPAEVAPTGPTAQEQYESQKVSPWAVLASGLGDAVAGRAADTSWADKLNKEKYDQTVGKELASKKSAEDIRQFNEKMNFDRSKFDRQLLSDKELLKMRLNAEMSARDAKASKAEAPKELNSTDKKRRDDATSAFNGLKDMKDALNQGTNTFSLIGDNNYTAARRKFIENFGRLQSGGAISADEVANFEKLAPGPMDSKEIQQKKLANLEEQLRRVAGGLGTELPSSGMKQQSSKPAWAK